MNRSGVRRARTVAGKLAETLATLAMMLLLVSFEAPGMTRYRNSLRPCPACFSRARITK